MTIDYTLSLLGSTPKPFGVVAGNLLTPCMRKSPDFPVSASCRDLQAGSLCSPELRSAAQFAKSRFQFCYHIIADNSRQSCRSRLGERDLYACLACPRLGKGGNLRLFNSSTSTSPFYEILYSFNRRLIGLSPFSGYAYQRLRAGACAYTQGAPRRAVGKIRQPACASSEDRDLATNDLTIRRIHELPGQRRSEWSEHPRRRGE